MSLSVVNVDLYSDEPARKIPGFPGYSVTREGTVIGRGGKVLKLQVNPRTGYVSVNLWNNNQRWPTRLHRLVALMFIPNPLGLPTVNHMDGNKLHNCAYNLEWVTQADNNDDAMRTGLNVLEKPVMGRNVRTGEIHLFRSVNSAAKAMNVSRCAITNALRGASKTSAGHEWKFRRDWDDCPDEQDALTINGRLLRPEYQQNGNN
jgi:hypothetical protein